MAKCLVLGSSAPAFVVVPPEPGSPPVRLGGPAAGGGAAPSRSFPRRQLPIPAGRRGLAVARVVGWCLLGTLVAAGAEAAPPGPVVLENAAVRYTIAADGRNLAFVDRATGVDYLRPGAASPCAWLRSQGREHPVTEAILAEDRLSFRFGEAGTAVLRVESRPSQLRLTVESAAGPELESLVFLNVPLTLQGRPGEPFGACAFSLNLHTRVDALPALQSELRAACHAKFGLPGASVAVVAAPPARMLSVLQEVVAGADQLPLCKVAGPWAHEVPFNHGSYLFNFGSLTETNVDDWIGMAQSLGFTQVDNHGGGAGFFRFGDFALNPRKWPGGWDTYGRIVARLHAAGIASIFHTYAFFIDKQSKYVTPVPDPRLDAFRTFTVAEPLAVDATEIRVNEPTAGLSTITGFFEHNSVVLHLGDELVTFGGVSAEAPWRFTGVQRGALGTKAAAHAAGARARHLKECFGLFVPDVATSLFEEIAANHADIVNRADFDGLYLDAIDGSSILRGADECWYWADKFVIEIQKRLKKPVGMEMSAMWHHFWQYRTRWQAWDYPQRGHRRFVDLHAQSVNGGLLLPLHLGWWNFQSFDPPQIEPTYPEVMEQLGARLIGWDAGVSLTGGVDRDRLRTVPLFRRAVDILRTCEQLRHAGVFDDRAKAELRAPDAEFALVTGADGKPGFRRAHSLPHTVARAEPWTRAWSGTNPFPAQPVRLRIEALMTAAAPEGTNGLLLADWSPTNRTAWQTRAAAGVDFAFTPEADATNPPVATLAATNTGAVPRNAAWAQCRRSFAPPLDLKQRQGLGVWIEGDGSGALLAFRLESPQHLAYGAIADRYVTLDFTGRRFVTLVETESARWSDYTWNDGKGAYNAYRETIDFGAVDTFSVWLQDLPAGAPVRCRVGPVHAVPLRATGLNQPALQVNGATLRFPVEVPSGGWIEANGPDDCTVYGPKGEPLGKVVPEGAWPTLPPGANAFEFGSTEAAGPSPRARITVFSRGPAVAPVAAAPAR